MRDLPGRHRTQIAIGPGEVGDAAQLARWQREQDLLEQQHRDDRALLRGRVIWIVVLTFIALDLAVSLALILVFTA